MHYIGIDPGKSGGLALLDPHGCNIVAVKMPDSDRDLLELLQAWAYDGRGSGSNGTTGGVRPIRAMLERVGASPQMGVVSAFTFGRGYGALLMALTAAQIPFDQVVPRKWQELLGCSSGGDKNITKRRAQQLFPSVPVTHAIADAMLLAEYCRRIHTGSVHPPSAARGTHGKAKSNRTRFTK